MNRRRCNERGFMAAEWVAAVGLLLVPTYVAVVSVSQVPRARSDAQVIATESARAGVRALSCRAANDLAVQTAKEVGTNVLSKAESPTLSSDVGDFRAGGSYSVTTRIAVPVVLIPGQVQFKIPGFEVSATHTEPLDTYRFYDEPACEPGSALDKQPVAL